MDHNTTFAALYWDEITSCPDILTASFFEVDQRYGYLQYAVGGKVYQYDPDEKKTKLMKDYGSRRISLFKYSRSATSFDYYMNQFPETWGKRFVPVSRGLVCATYEPSSPAGSGKVEVFDVPQFSAPFTTFLTFDGFGKVIGAVEAEKPYGW